MVRFHFTRQYLQLSGLMLIVFINHITFLVDGNSTNQTVLPIGTFGNDDGNGAHVQRLAIYTYFERIHVANRTTGMTDDDDDSLLRFWKERWQAAGYMPVVLSEKDASFHQLPSNNGKPESGQYITKQWFDSIQSKLDALRLDDFSRVQFRKWIAMVAVGGGWYSDYDNFPLHPLHRGNKGNTIQETLPNDGRMTVHNIISPTLASGTAKEWMATLEALLDDAKIHCHQPNSIADDQYHFDCFYTDSLAIHSLQSDDHKMKPLTGRLVFAPFQRKDPVAFDNAEFCSVKTFKHKWTVHFSPEIMQGGMHVPPSDRLPKFRLKVAKSWLDRLDIVCPMNATQAKSS